MAGIVRGLLSLKCSADVIPGRCEVRKLQVVDRVIDRLCKPFVERRRLVVNFSCLCPELVINSDLEELTSDLVGVSCYFQVSSHFDEPTLNQAQNQYKAMVRGARERERKDSQHLPEGRIFALLKLTAC